MKTIKLLRTPTPARPLKLPPLDQLVAEPLQSLSDDGRLAMERDGFIWTWPLCLPSKIEKVDVPLAQVSAAAWIAREKARVMDRESGTRVGAAVWTDHGTIHRGANQEHPWRTSTHAERAALSAMSQDAPPGAKARLILIAAERDFFTPCGGCLDWIWQHGGGKQGGEDTMVAFQGAPDGDIRIFHFWELMPYYPG